MPITIEPNIHRSACQTCGSDDIDDVRAIHFRPPGGRSGGGVVALCRHCRGNMAGVGLTGPCPYTGLAYSEVPGYISGYGCPVCKGIGPSHLTLPA